ncbi:MAG: putative DNA-binding domain-containing protein [Thiomicrorhabdus sp.]|nr:putative DNA-binding domain-containing protein [Thiomicrorhabdus sp.]
MSADSTARLPYFQQLQQQFAAHIRDPENTPYAPKGELPIEVRRLVAYQELFFNNIESFFSQIFPVCADILGEERWLTILREYMVKHNAQTPLFHELGQEFLLFLEAEFEPKESDPAFLLELAHYEWVELALSVSTDVGFEGGEKTSKAELSWDKSYQLSPVAWPLAYEWPVHRLSEVYQPKTKPAETTTLLVYRHLEQDDTDSMPQEKIDFIELSPLLYQSLMALGSASSAQEAFETVAEPYNIPADQLQPFAEQTLHELVSLNILRPVDK